MCIAQAVRIHVINKYFLKCRHWQIRAYYVIMYRHIISLPAYYVITGKLCLEVLDPSTAFLHLWFTNALQWHICKIMIRSPIDEGRLQKLLSWNLHLKRVLKKCPKSSSNAPLKSVLVWHDIMQQKSLISRWVNRWVSWSFIVSDWRLLSHLRALRACFLIYFPYIDKLT